MRWTAHYADKAAAESAASRFTPLEARLDFSSGIVTRLNADAAVQEVGTVSGAVTEPASLDLDCTGSWSPCTAACEAKEARQWTTTVAQSGNGAACPNATTDCTPGEDGCVAHVDCTGAWSACTTTCEAKEARSWTQTTAPSGDGAVCPTAATDCQPGQGGCQAARAEGRSPDADELDAGCVAEPQRGTAIALLVVAAGLAGRL